MGADTYELDALLGSLRELDAVGVEIAEAALGDVVAAARATAAAGSDAYGAPWKPTKPGDKALPNVAGAISGEVSGSSRAVLVLKVAGYKYRFHQLAKGKRLPKRAILPEDDQGVPAPMLDALRRAAQRVIAKKLGGKP